MSKIIIMQRWKVIAAGLLALAVITAGSISLPAHSAEPRVAAGRDVGFGTGFADLISEFARGNAHRIVDSEDRGSRVLADRGGVFARHFHILQDRFQRALGRRAVRLHPMRFF